MTKLVMVFKMPEDQESYKLHFNGPKYSFVLADFRQWLRNKSKYEDAESLTIEEIREKLSELEREYFE